MKKLRTAPPDSPTHRAPREAPVAGLRQASLNGTVLAMAARTLSFGASVPGGIGWLTANFPTAPGWNNVQSVDPP
jgi:hypothetical protein